MGRGNYLTYKFNRRIKEQQSCLYLDQISLSNEFMRNMLQKKPWEQVFGKCMYFKISFSL